MKNRMMMLLAFVAAFLFTAPVIAAPPEADEPASEETKADGEAGEDSKEAETTKEKAPEAASDTDGASEEEPAADTDGADTDGAEEVPAELENDDDAVAALKQLVDAARGGHWSLMAALLIMLLVYAVKRFGLKDKLPSKAVPWVAAVASMGGYVAAALMVEGAVVMDAVLGGLATGAAAVGLWEMLFKHFLGAKEDAPEPEKTEPEEDSAE